MRGPRKAFQKVSFGVTMAMVGGCHFYILCGLYAEWEFAIKHYWRQIAAIILLSFARHLSLYFKHARMNKSTSFSR
jgi:ABC-type enterochelin transport system permease subunit